MNKKIFFLSFALHFFIFFPFDFENKLKKNHQEGHQKHSTSFSLTFKENLKKPFTSPLVKKQRKHLKKPEKNQGEEKAQHQRFSGNSFLLKKIPYPQLFINQNIQGIVDVRLKKRDQEIEFDFGNSKAPQILVQHVFKHLKDQQDFILHWMDRQNDHQVELYFEFIIL
jgi:hypothetical protein